MESTAQRNSRIAQDDSMAHSAFNHAIDFFRGLATYEIKQEPSGSFNVIQKTPRGQLTGYARSYEDAVKKLEDWKNSDLCNGYSRKQLGELI